MVQHDNKKEAMWREEERESERERKKKTGAIYLKAINHSCRHFFSWVINKHASYFKTFSAAVSATWMTEHDVTAAHTDLLCEIIIGKTMVWKNTQSP